MVIFIVKDFSCLEDAVAGVVVNLVQGTPEWANWRFDGMGGSDSPASLNKSPYKTRRQLAIEKINRREVGDSSQDFIFAKGHKTEALIRRNFEEYIGEEAKPVCMEHPKFRVLRASLDGLTGKHGVLEAKLVGKEVLERAIETGEIPEHHFIQIQHNCNVSGADLGQWYGHNGKDRGVCIEVPADKKFIKMLQAEELAFWELVEAKVLPELSNEDYLEPDDVTALEELRELKELLENAEIAYDAAKKQIVDRYNHPKIAGAGIKLFQVERSGAIDYLKIPELKAALELLKPEYVEQFRKASSKSWTVKFDVVKKGIKNGKV